MPDDIHSLPPSNNTLNTAGAIGHDQHGAAHRTAGRRPATTKAQATQDAKQRSHRLFAQGSHATVLAHRRRPTTPSSAAETCSGIATGMPWAPAAHLVCAGTAHHADYRFRAGESADRAIGMPTKRNLATSRC
jgi:hypothetical protein